MQANQGTPLAARSAGPAHLYSVHAWRDIFSKPGPADIGLCPINIDDGDPGDTAPQRQVKAQTAATTNATHAEAAERAWPQERRIQDGAWPEATPQN